MKEQDSKTSLGLIALLAAMAITLAFLIVALTALRELPTKISCIISAVICLIALYYGIRGYKVPHGNTIRYLLLAFAVAEASGYDKADGCVPASNNDSFFIYGRET